VSAFVLAASLLPASGAECEAWCSDGAPEKGLDLTAVAYQVDVYGALALGRLTLEFRNGGPTPITAQYRLPSAFPLRVETVGLTVDEREITESGDPQSPDPQLPDPQSAGPQPSDRRSSRSQPVRVKTERARATPLATVRPEEKAVVEVTFRLVPAVAQGRVRLLLPAPPLPALAGDRVRFASAKDRPLPLRVPVLVIVHHDDRSLAIESPTHQIMTDYVGGLNIVQLVQGDMANLDFELLLALPTVDVPVLHGYVGPARSGVRQIAAVLTPPARPREGAARAKCMIFVLDTSGSMTGNKIIQAREALYASIEQLAEGDLFNIVEFDNAFTLMAPEPLVVSDQSRQEAAEWLKRQSARGGTTLVPALAAAFRQPGGMAVEQPASEQPASEQPASEQPGAAFERPRRGKTRHGMIVVLTDGNVSDPRQVDDLLARELGEARLFFVGIGADVNQQNIVRFAEIGRGAAAFAEDANKIISAVASLFDSVSLPLAWDLEVDWGGAQIESVEPQRLPDLYAGRPVTVFARVRGEPPRELRLRASTVDGAREFTIVLPTADLEALSSTTAQR
jgi:Ca-activated chloride channel family protein